MIIIITQIGFPLLPTFCLITNIVLHSDFYEDILKIVIKADFLYYIRWRYAFLRKISQFYESRLK